MSTSGQNTGSARMSRAAVPRADGGVLLTPEDVARITGLSVETLAQWRSQRRGIPYVKISRSCVRYRQADLDAWISERIVPIEKGPSIARRS